jgi:ketosteroid isomerase-like protein
MENEALHSFTAFMQLRERAALAYVRGEPDLLTSILAHAEPASFFDPRGGATVGPEEVAQRYAHDARAFGPSGEGKLEIVHMEASGDVAYWVGYQYARAQLAGQDTPATFHLRVTETFRREGGTWKLVHRHADDRR